MNLSIYSLAKKAKGDFVNKLIPVDELQIGMYIAAEGNDWVPRKRKKRKGYIKTQATIDKIKSLGVLEVCIDTSDNSASEQPVEAKEVPQSSTSESTLSSSSTEIKASMASEASSDDDVTSNVQKDISEVADKAPKGGLLDEYKTKEDEAGTGNTSKKGIAELAQKHVSGAAMAPFSKEIIRAKKLHIDAKLRVEMAMQKAAMGKPFDISDIEGIADELVKSIESNRNALSMMTALKNKDKYLFEHSVNSGVFMALFAKHLDLSVDVIHDLVTGAILHDIGMIEVPGGIINKPGKLTKAEEAEMHRHITVGRMILGKNRGVPAIALEVCKLHHERLDGQGYMSRLHQHEINDYGRMGAIVDAYSALTSYRSYRNTFSPGAAIKLLLELSGGYLDGKLVIQFIQCINIYPVGSLVELDDNRVGVVHELNQTQKEKPIIRVFYNSKNENYFEAETIDLGHPDAGAKILKAADIEDYNIQLEDII